MPCLFAAPVVRLFLMPQDLQLKADRRQTHSPNLLLLLLLPLGSHPCRWLLQCQGMVWDEPQETFHPLCLFSSAEPCFLNVLSARREHHSILQVKGVPGLR